MTILVSGYLVRRPLGGLAWHYLQYLVGLARLGHRVIYVEDGEDQASCLDPSTLPDRADLETDQNRSPIQYVQKDPSYGLAFVDAVFRRLQLDTEWAYYDAHSSTWHGSAASNILSICKSADLLLNVSHSIELRDWFLDVPARALIDTDPVFGQLRHKYLSAWAERAARHTSFFTFGENVGRPGCTIPSDGLPWRPTRQPVVLDLWPGIRAPSDGALTTVMSWSSYPPTKDGAMKYGTKSHSFLPYLDLPASALPGALELAIECSPRVWSDLESRGWQLVDPMEDLADPWSYRSYIQSSRAEFSIAKHGYVASNSGWFSERSAAYLASGRPVVVQETGFSEWMGLRPGVIPFQTPEEAVAGIRELEGNYERHASAAVHVASDFFDHEVVLPKLVNEALTPAGFDSSKLGTGVTVPFDLIVSLVCEHIPDGGSLVLLDDNQWGLSGSIQGRKCRFLVERDGAYWGKPASDEQAVSELLALRDEGATHLVFGEPAFWWTGHYEGFCQHLNDQHSLVCETEFLRIYELASGAQSG